jgi:hypothetical protein
MGSLSHALDKTDDRLMRALFNFRDRTPDALTPAPSSSLKIILLAVKSFLSFLLLKHLLFTGLFLLSTLSFYHSFMST